MDKCPNKWLHFLRGKSLAGIKKDVSHRPIAVAEILRRLTSKCIAQTVQDKATLNLKPLQFGVGIKVGCEGIVHGVRNTSRIRIYLMMINICF